MTIRSPVVLPLFFVVALFNPLYCGAAQSGNVVCIAANGELLVRAKKCLSSETKAMMSTLQRVGAKGAIGPAGEAAVRNRRVEVISDIQIIRVNGQAHVFAFCNDDEVVLGGGCGCFDGFCNSLVASSGPMPVDSKQIGRKGWRCTLIPSVDPDLGSYKAYSVCAEAN